MKQPHYLRKAQNMYRRAINDGGFYFARWIKENKIDSAVKKELSDLGN